MNQRFSEYYCEEIDEIIKKYGLEGALNACKERIPPISDEVARAAREKLMVLAKPPGSLGVLEELYVRIAGITGKLDNSIDKKTLLVFAADNGVIAEGVSSAPKYVTLRQARHIAAQRSGAGVLCKNFGCKTLVYDVGIDGDTSVTGIINKKIRHGTGNIRHEAAMTREEAILSILVGIDAGYTEGKRSDVLGIGEMGIGNTTTASAVLSVLSGKPVREVTDYGGGLTDAGYENKIAVIEDAKRLHNADVRDPVEVVSKLGGLDLCAMCGGYIGAAMAGVPVVIDGFPSAVAALIAKRLAPDAVKYMFASHKSSQNGFGYIMDGLRLEPYLDLRLRLGEGSGSVLMFEVMSAACAIGGMATFAEEGIDTEYLEGVRFGRGSAPAPRATQATLPQNP